jgi:hypothetical protein
MYENNVISSTRENKSASNDNSFKSPWLNRNYVSEIIFYNGIGQTPLTLVNKNFTPAIVTTEQDSKKPQATKNNKKFYVGLIGGIDASTVKFEKFQNAGFTYGVLLGYQLNNRWSVETGSFLEKKYYYSDGQYFNASKIYPASANAKIIDVTGNCKMIEIPVSVKYDFGLHKKSNWFATLGGTSYLMKKENYYYHVYYGSAGPYYHEKDTNSTEKNFLSNLSFSAGYTHRLGNFADLRIEPYLKIPISGMGVGDLPLFSTGVQVGIIKKF